LCTRTFTPIVGWDTHKVGDDWLPTFTRARHLYTARELEYCRKNDNPGIEGVFADSVAPILDAGLADVVPEDANLGDGLRLEPSTGHTPGHVSLWIESAGEVALISGDFLHHPVQCAVPMLAEVGDADVEQARETRRHYARAAETGALFLAFASHAAAGGWRRAATFRFVPVD
jgi:glyoxylase-like metal-dependent hydrolase (beta-lactamase superfamily II)